MANNNGFMVHFIKEKHMGKIAMNE